MKPSDFADVVRAAVIGALADFRAKVPDEVPYALAIILGQCGNYVGYAIATEEGLRRVASEFVAKGYYYETDDTESEEHIATWLRWSNPDDGWHYGDFDDRFEIAALLADLVKGQAFGDDAEELEEFCTNVLASLQRNNEWEGVGGQGVVVGVTYGSDPRDFLRTATRANSFDIVSNIWAEQWRGEEVSSSISGPD